VDLGVYSIRVFAKTWVIPIMNPLWWFMIFAYAIGTMAASSRPVTVSAGTTSSASSSSKSICVGVNHLSIIL